MSGIFLADAVCFEHCGIEQGALYILSLISSSVAFRLLGELKENKLHNSGIPLQTKSLKVVDHHERLGAPRIASVPYRSIYSDATAKQARPGRG